MGWHRAATALAAITGLLGSGLSSASAAHEATIPEPPPALGCTAAAATATRASVPERPAFERIVEPGLAATLTFDGAQLVIDPLAVLTRTTIGVTPLAEAQLPPLDAELTNVTAGPRRGYRFTPHPYTFQRKIQVSLPYDPVAVGSDTDNLLTFYYDDQRGCWRPLQRIRVDTERHLVVSVTDHFTDMINGTMVAPDHPEGTSFNPTQIKDIKAADPGSRVNLIEAPSPNNHGDNRLSYPIEVPPGRGGIQPQLAVQYSSSDGNGWLGVGWDLPMATITIDTRWGVPRYDASKETETYLIDGQQLTPVAHRGELQDRTAEKVFHTRVEGAFTKIVRHGSAPDNYSWEVTDKSGLKRFYGGTTESTLADNGGNRFLWSLREVRDTRGNFMRYHCVRVDDAGVGDGTGTTVPGRNLYLDRITYTGHGTTEGRYQVKFVRGTERRPDVVIDARGGFKRVTAHLLKRVEVSLDDRLIRRYDFGYREGAFFKTLLGSITQFGDDGNVFNKHEFEYFDEVRDAQGNYKPFEEAKAWQVGSDGLDNPVLLEQSGASALGSSSSRSFGGHGYVGFGTSPTKPGTAGLKFGFNRADGDGLVALVDVNGDSLPDKVFRKDGKTFYRKNLSGPTGPTTFGATPIEIPLPAIGSENSSSTTIGIESYLGGVAAQLDYVETFARTDRYLNDVNGDGISDLVTGGGVLYGHLDANGNPEYSANSADTPVPVGSGTVNGDVLGDFAEELERRLDTFPLLDGVRRWVAPFSGTVNITGDVRLTKNTSVDGVRVAIQREDAELWSARIPALDFDPRTPAGVASVTVAKGDRIYFRVQSVRDGNDDQVSWDPRIEYTAIGGTDVNNLAHGVYQASDDFTLGGRTTQVTAPATGTLHLSGNLEKTGATTDDVTAVITVNGAEVFSQKLDHDATGTIAVDQDIQVTKNDTLRWRVRIDSPIDLRKVRWIPKAHYTSAEGVDRVVDADGNPVLVVNPPYDLDMYPVNTTTAPQSAFTAPQDGTLIVRPSLTFHFTDGQPLPDAQITATVKRRGVLVAKRILTMTDGVVPPASFQAAVSQGDVLFFDLSALDPRLRTALTGQSMQVSFDGTSFVAVPSGFHGTVVENAFPQPYRGWGGVGYNGNDRTEQAIVQDDLVADDNYGDQLPDGVPAPGSPERQAFEDDPRIDAPKVFPFGPVPHKALWMGADDTTWVASGSVSSSRLGSDTVDVPVPGDVGGAVAVPRIARSKQISATVGVGPVGLSEARGSGAGELDFIDLNGDRFPDAVGSGGTQYTEARGGLGTRMGSLGEDAVRRSDNTARNGQLNVAASTGSAAKTTPNGRGHAVKSGSDMPSLGLGGNLGGGESTGRFDLLDINGDDLPDRIYADGFVALNLGYRFADRELWGGGTLNDASTSNAGVNLGANTGFYGFATGASLSTGTSTSAASLMDMNGDGLLDRVFSGTGPVEVSLNTGNGFKPRTPWQLVTPDNHTELSGVNSDDNATLGGGAYFTIGFCFLIGCIVVNPGGDASVGQSRQELALRDINGDGFADRLSSTNDGQLVVAENHTDRTNLLKTVRRPMGATLTFDYQRDGNTADLPQSRWVLSRTALHDGHAGDGQDVQLSTYSYSGGRYDRLEREFYGYRKVIAEQHDNQAVFRTLTSEFHNDSHYRRGLPTRTVTTDGQGNPFLETINSYELRDVGTGAAGDASSTTATIFPQLVRTDRRFYEGRATPGKTTFTTTSYDEFGNVVQSFDAADTGPDDDVETRMEYSPCFAGIPVKIEVRGAGTLMRRREATIDCGTANMTQARQFLATGGPAVSDMTYQPNGNLESFTGPPNKDGQRHRLTYEYDTVVGVHIEATTDSFGHRSETTHDLRYGQPVTTRDQNNQEITYRYDSVGRIDDVTGPYEKPENRVTVDFEYHPEAVVPFAVSRHADRNSDGTVKPDTIDTVLFADGLKRPLQTKKDATVSGVPVMTVSGRSVFDFAGRPVQQFYPVTEPKGLGNTMFNPAFDGVQPTRITYDVLDRTTRTVLPDDTVTQMDYGFGPDRRGVTRFETVTTDANGIEMRTYRDTRELTIAVREHTIWTSYVYDPLSQITEVTDDRNNRTTAAYDNFGRRAVIDSPDSGKVESSYDLAGNLTRKVTAKLAAVSKAIEYDYEFNRLKAIRYPLFTDDNVTYTYGAPGAANNGAGRVTAIRDGAGTVTRQYGPLGEVTSETRVAAVPGNPSFTTSSRFDSWNRVLQMTFPDGEVLTYNYDSGGQVTSARGQKGPNAYPYLTRLDYDKFGQRVLLETGTGVRSTYTYDAADRRLTTMTSQLSNGYQFQNLNYEYDDLGNITAITNNTVPPSSPDVGRQVGGPSQQAFEYDELNRLTHASGSYTPRGPNTDRYQLDIAYDSIHNITSKNQLHEIVTNGNAVTQHKTTYNNGYTYGSGRPHAPSVVGPHTMQYDANGNVISRDQQPRPRRQLIWDEENRLACSHENVQSKTLPQDPSSCDNPGGAPDVRFAYDDSGNRVIKDSSQTHIYPNRNYSTQGNKQFKHVFIGNTKLVTKLVEGNNKFEDRQFYTHGDHLGSTGFVTDDSGRLAEHIKYFPGGETWVQEHPSQPVPDQFTGKELDPETGYYYYGARYYDPRAQLWQSPDPILGTYLDGKRNDGVYNSANLASYTYAYNNPVHLTDPDGLSPVRINIINKVERFNKNPEVLVRARTELKSLLRFVDDDPKLELSMTISGDSQRLDADPHMLDVHLVDNSFTKADLKGLFKQYGRGTSDKDIDAAAKTLEISDSFSTQGVTSIQSRTTSTGKVREKERGLTVIRIGDDVKGTNLSGIIGHEFGHHGGVDIEGRHDRLDMPTNLMHLPIAEGADFANEDKNTILKFFGGTSRHRVP